MLVNDFVVQNICNEFVHIYQSTLPRWPQVHAAINDRFVLNICHQFNHQVGRVWTLQGGGEEDGRTGERGGGGGVLMGLDGRAGSSASVSTFRFVHTIPMPPSLIGDPAGACG